MPLPSSFKNLDLLFNESAGGIQVSGDSGTGKSCVMALMMQQLAADPHAPGFALIDPHGDLCRDLEAFCASLPERFQRRVIVVHPADTRRKLPGMNPLAVSTAGLDEFTWRARVLKKAGHCGRFLLHAWGERDFNSKPLLLKFTSWFTETLGLARLTIPDVRHFFNPQSPIFAALTRVAPDPIAQLELTELANLRYRDREDLWASTKNRFLGLLKNELVELSLGRVGPVLNVQDLIQEGAIVLINLEPGGVLRDEDREILANAWLTEFIFAAYNTPRAERRPFAVFVDELPLFMASAQLLTESLTQVRKFKLHFCCAHAGTQFFEGGTKNQLLNALTGACRIHCIFRHQHEVDATYFAKLVKLPELSPTNVKHVQRQPMQFQDGHEIVILTDTAENWQEAEQQGGSEADGTTNTSTDTRGRTENTGITRTNSQEEQSLRRTVADARAETTGNSSSTAQAHGRTRTSTNSWSNTTSRGGSRTFKQTLVPRIVVRDIVTSIQFLTTEEQVTQAASSIARNPTGTALLYIAGRGTVKVRFPLPKNPFRGTPKAAKKQLARLWQRITARPEYATYQEIAAERQAFTAKLTSYLAALAAQRLPQALPAPARAVTVPSNVPTKPPDSPLAI